MAVWSKVLPLTAVSQHCLGSNSTLGMWKVASDLELDGGFRRVLRFPQPVTTGLSRLSLEMAEKVTKKTKFQIIIQ